MIVNIFGFFFCLGIFFLVFTGGKNLKKNIAAPLNCKPEKWPNVAVIVPATGQAPGMDRCIQSLVNLDYTDYEIIFVTSDSKDPASAIIQRAIKESPFSRLVFSGKAQKCGQKNHNLLAGIAAASEKTEILVFCDSTRFAETSWLKGLIDPIISEPALVSSGYHQIVPGSGNTAHISHAIAVLILYLIKENPLLTQPWGGSTAISKKAFLSLKIHEEWSHNIVDDVCLAAHLNKKKVPVLSGKGEYLKTPLYNESFSTLLQWLIRQWIYLKFYFPGLWIGAGICCYFLCGLLFLSAIKCMGVLAGWTTLLQAFFPFSFLVFFTGLGLFIRRFHPCPGGIPGWLAALCFAIFVAGLSHLKTLFTMKICWKGITYHVNWRGIVKKIEGA
jgi:ceramide glucosyltransferase